MWCPHCESDVVSEISSDGLSLRCTHCGTAIQQVFAPSMHPETQAARELLERWSRQGITNSHEETLAGIESEVTPPVHQQASASSPHPEPEATPAAEPVTRTGRTGSGMTQGSGRDWRLDPGHQEQSGPRKQRTSSRRMSTMKSRSVRESARRSDRSHEDVPSPHFNLDVPADRPLPGKSESTWGQVLAYSGVGVLTVGTVFVVWGYFGGVASFASTGWLLSTAGQMLLLLGVVTLVSGGMQQTTHEVGQRIEYLNGRMYRIERSTQKLLRGPHFGQRQRRSQSLPTRENDQQAE